MLKRPFLTGLPVQQHLASCCLLGLFSLELFLRDLPLQLVVCVGERVVQGLQARLQGVEDTVGHRLVLLGLAWLPHTPVPAEELLSLLHGLKAAATSQGTRQPQRQLQASIVERLKRRMELVARHRQDPLRKVLRMFAEPQPLGKEEGLSPMVAILQALENPSRLNGSIVKWTI